MDRDLRMELYLALLLLGADEMLLGSLAAWRDDAGNNEALVADLANWNEAKLLEMKEWLATMTGEEFEAARERIRQYEKARAADQYERARGALSPTA
jgi:hypothetical protein